MFAFPETEKSTPCSTFTDIPIPFFCPHFFDKNHPKYTNRTRLSRILRISWFSLFSILAWFLSLHIFHGFPSCLHSLSEDLGANSCNITVATPLTRHSHFLRSLRSLAAKNSVGPLSSSQSRPQPWQLLRHFPKTIFRNANLKNPLLDRKILQPSHFQQKRQNANSSHSGKDKPPEL